MSNPSTPQKNSMHQVFFTVKQAIQNILRSKFMSTVIVSSMLVSLSILGFLLLIMSDLQYASSQLSQQLKIVVFLEDEASIDKVAETIGGIKGVKNLVKITKDDALKMMQEELGLSEKKTDTTLKNNLLDKNNIFPDVIEVETFQLNMIQEIGSQIKALAHIEEVKYNQELAEQLKQIQDAVQLIGFTITGVLFMASLAIIINTIQLAVYHRKNEIEIMQLLGAPAWLIRLPFVIEGSILGFISSVLACILLILWRVFPVMQLKKIFQFIPIQPSIQPLFTILGIVFFIGIFMGTLGSLMSIHRYLRLKKA